MATGRDEDWSERQKDGRVGGRGSLRVIAVLHSKFLSIIWIFTLYLHITLIQNISFKNPSTLITFFFYNKPTILETDRNSKTWRTYSLRSTIPGPRLRIQVYDITARAAWCTRMLPGSWGKAETTPTFRTSALWRRPWNTLPHWSGYFWSPDRFSPR